MNSLGLNKQKRIIVWIYFELAYRVMLETKSKHASVDFTHDVKFPFVININTDQPQPIIALQVTEARKLTAM